MGGSRLLSPGNCRPAGGAWNWAGLGPQGRVPGLRWRQRRSYLARDGRGFVGAGRAPLPGLGAWQDPHDVCFLVARHPFQTAALDRGGGERAPFESVAHVLEGFQIAGGRCPRGCGDKRTSVPSLKSLALIQRRGLTHSKEGERWAGWSSKEVGCWEDLNSNLPSTTYCQVTGGKPPGLFPHLWTQG